MAWRRNTTCKFDRTEHTCWEGRHSENKWSWFNQVNIHRIRCAYFQHSEALQKARATLDKLAPKTQRKCRLKCTFSWEVMWTNTSSLILNWYINNKMNKLHLINLNATLWKWAPLLLFLTCRGRGCVFVFTVLLHQWSMKHSVTSYTSCQGKGYKEVHRPLLFDRSTDCVNHWSKTARQSETQKCAWISKQPATASGNC